MHNKCPLLATLIICWVLAAGTGAAEPTISKSHALAMNGVPKYAAGFDHFDYAQPQASKGGKVNLAAIGTYDSLNPYIIKGVPAAGLGLIYDTLTARSQDEPFTLYGLLAETIELPADRSWVIYHLHPQARFHDGKPVTAADVVFSFNILREQGDPLYSKYWADVEKVESLDTRRVKFHLGQKPNPELALILGELPVLPRHFWEGRDFAKPSLTIPLGSGPYRIASFATGRSITYRRVDDYWAKDLPVNKGQYNFDQIHYDYYRDPTVAIYAFKAGEFDFRLENISKAWATAYTGPPFVNGMIIKEEIDNDVDQGMQGFVYNTRRPIFRDKRVRQALAFAFDFEWTNKHLFYGQYTRSTSYFSNSELAASGLPGPDEQAVLEPLRAQLSPEVFTQVYQPPSTDGSGNIRANLRRALQLLKQTGWRFKAGRLTNDRDGKPFAFELLLVDPTFERVVLPFKQNLKRLGIEMEIRVVDTAQYINLLRDYDYDMIVATFGQSESPGNEQREFWSSEAADIPGTRNYAGVKDPAVDQLVEQVIGAPDRKALVTCTRALDRVLLWGFYVIPQWHIAKYRVAYWNKFSRPSQSPRYGLGFPNTWWVDPAKDAKVNAYRRTKKTSES
jgi:microcin C transport system substrate-binding protein